MAVIPLHLLLTPEKIESLASRSNFRLGKQILKDGVIKITTDNIFRKVAEVAQKKSASPQTVDLLSNSKGLRYSCTCTSRKNIFCEHCIAVALNLHEK